MIRGGGGKYFLELSPLEWRGIEGRIKRLFLLLRSKLRLKILLVDFVPGTNPPNAASYPGASLLDMGAQGRKGRRKEERRLADFVFKMAESVMADDYAIFKNEFRPVNLAFLEEKIVCPHPSCEGEAVFCQKNRL